MNHLIKSSDFTTQMTDLISDYPKMSDFSQAVEWALSHANTDFAWASNVSGDYYTWHTCEMVGIPECVIMFKYLVPSQEVILVAITEIIDESENVFLDLRV